MQVCIAKLLNNRYIRYTVSSPIITIIDWTDYNNDGVKVYQDENIINTQTGQQINGVKLNNINGVVINIDAFQNNALNYSKKRRAKQCECIIYPQHTNMQSWVLFVETKYTKTSSSAIDPRNQYIAYAISQIRESVNYFRYHNIIARDKIVYAIISFPNLYEPFSAFIAMEDIVSEMFYIDKIILRATNTVHIINENDINLVGE